VKNPLVSIVMPVFNSEKYVSDAILSVINQSYFNWQLIIVDDGSTDSSVLQIKQYLHDVRINLVRQGNHGPSVARNRGLELSCGELIAFIDSDDVWVNTKIEEQVAIFEQDEDLAMISADMRLLNENNVVAESCFEHNGYEFVASGDIYKNLLKENFIFTPMVLIRKRVLDAVGKFDPNLRISEDRDLWLRIARNHKIIVLDRILGDRRIHKTNTTSDRELYAKHQIKMFEKQLLLLKEPKSSLACEVVPIIVDIIKKRYVDLGFFYLRKANTADARLAFRSCLKYGGRRAFRIKMLLAFFPPSIIRLLKFAKVMIAN
jgi:glycosyltransferase involved in cell wall biosynthesis